MHMDDHSLTMIGYDLIDSKERKLVVCFLTSCCLWLMTIAYISCTLGYPLIRQC